MIEDKYPEDILADIVSIYNSDPSGFRKKPKNKKYREGVSAVIGLLGIRKITKMDWFLEFPDSDPPDVNAYIYLYEPGKAFRFKHIVPIEIVRFPRYIRNQSNWDCSRSDTENIIKYIETSKTNFKSYESGSVLFVHTDLDLNLDLKVLFDWAKNLDKKFEEIWNIGMISNDQRKYMMTEFYPELKQASFDVFEIFN